MKKILQTIEKWLETHKNLLEAISALSAISSLILAVIAIRLSNSIADTQALLDREQFLPRFQVDNFTKNPYHNTDLYSDMLNVYRVGGVYHDLKVKTATFLQFSFLQQSTNSAQNICLPINDYYTCQFGRHYDGCGLQSRLTSTIFTNDSDRVFTLVDQGNSRWKVSQMDFNFAEDFKKNSGYRFNGVIPRKFLKLEYQDIYGTPHSNYYEFSRNIGSTGSLLQEPTGQTLFDIHQKQKSLNLAEISYEFLEGKLKNNDYPCTGFEN